MGQPAGWRDCERYDHEYHDSVPPCIGAGWSYGGSLCHFPHQAHDGADDRALAQFCGTSPDLGPSSAPHPFLYYFEEDNRPQTRFDRDAGRGMAISIGRLRPDSQYDYKFVCLSHNTLRGAAGGGVLTAELLCAEGYMD